MHIAPLSMARHTLKHIWPRSGVLHRPGIFKRLSIHDDWCENIPNCNRLCLCVGESVIKTEHLGLVILKGLLAGCRVAWLNMLKQSNLCGIEFNFCSPSVSNYHPKPATGIYREITQGLDAPHWKAPAWAFCRLPGRLVPHTFRERWRGEEHNQVRACKSWGGDIHMAQISKTSSLLSSLKATDTKLGYQSSWGKKGASDGFNFSKKSWKHHYIVPMMISTQGHWCVRLR
jgi:hypothetical protein